MCVLTERGEGRHVMFAAVGGFVAGFFVGGFLAAVTVAILVGARR
jgi:hypothetical protein